MDGQMGELLMDLAGYLGEERGRRWGVGVDGVEVARALFNAGSDPEPKRITDPVGYSLGFSLEPEGDTQLGVYRRILKVSIET